MLRIANLMSGVPGFATVGEAVAYASPHDGYVFARAALVIGTLARVTIGPLAAGWRVWW